MDRFGGIEAVLFDYGMVLSGPPDAAAWAQMREITGLEEARLHAGYWASRHDYDRGALTGEEYWQAVGVHGGVSLDPAQVEALIRQDTELWTQLNLPMVEWAARLQAAGVRTGILSNLGDRMAEGVLAKFEWLAGFAHCTWSHALKMAKPEAEIYRVTAQALGTAPQRILFIDDRDDNVAAGIAAGMHVVQYLGHDAFESDMRSRGFGGLLEV